MPEQSQAEPKRDTGGVEAAPRGPAPFVVAVVGTILLGAVVATVSSLATNTVTAIDAINPAKLAAEYKYRMQGAVAVDSDDRGLMRDTVGAQTIVAGNGDNLIVLESDTGTPDTAGYPTTINWDEGDLVYGGEGADTFKFLLTIDGDPAILAKHDGNSKVVADENKHYHDHWVNGIGANTIADYNKDDGDTIIIAGHTVEVFKTEHTERDTVFHLRSNQGNAGTDEPRAGAHDGDYLGSIRILGAKISADELELDSGSYY